MQQQPGPTPQREVIHGDAVEWLAARPGLAHTSVIASLPDVSELGVTLERWREFFLAAARAALLAAADDGLCLFVQTDNKHEGRWVSKAGLALRVADALDIPLVFHKIVCRRPPGSLIHGRPGYTHLLAFSRRAVDAIRRLSPATTRIVVPCCGIGTILAVANARGFDVVGVERNRKRAEAARSFSLDAPEPDPSDMP